jgi:hypothetical protein
MTMKHLSDLNNVPFRKEKASPQIQCNISQNHSSLSYNSRVPIRRIQNGVVIHTVCNKPKDYVEVVQQENVKQKKGMINDTRPYFTLMGSLFYPIDNRNARKCVTSTLMIFERRSPSTLNRCVQLMRHLDYVFM